VVLEIKPDGLKRIEIFRHKKRICVVRELTRCDDSTYCCGYVETLPRNKGKSYTQFVDKIETDELTYSGNLFGLFDGVWFFGFDSAHVWNDEKSRSFKSVKKRTKKLCEEMVKKRI